MSRLTILGAAPFVAATGLLAACGFRETATSPIAADIDSPTLQTASAWTIKAPMPTARSNFAITPFTNAAGKTRIYVIGGLTQGNATAVVEAYDPTTNTWIKRAPMPAPRFLTNGATVLGNKIYVVGGWRSTEDQSPYGGFYEYTPATDTWRTLPPGPFLVGGGCCGSGASAAIGGQLYVYEGNNGSESRRMDRYDPATGTWTYMAESNAFHDGAAAVAIGSTFYLFGWSDVLEIYDPALDEWTLGAPMFTGRSLGNAVLNGKLYVFGGVDTTSVISREVKIYDPTLDQWTLGAGMTQLRAGVGVATVSHNGTMKAYVVGGTANAITAQFLKRNELFDPTIAP